MRFTSELRQQASYYGGIGREASLLVLANAVLSLNWGISGVIPGVYLPQVGLGGEQIGSLYTVSGLTSAVLGVPFAILSDRYGRRKGLLAGTALVGVSILFYAFTADYGLLLLSSLLSGVGYGLFFSNSNALLAERTSEGKRTVAFSDSFFAGTAGGALGSLLAMLPTVLRVHFGFAVASSYQAVYGVAGIIVLLGVVPVFFVKESRWSGQGFALPRRSVSVIVRYSAFNILIGLGAGLIIPIFSYWFYLKFGYTEAVTGPLNIMATVATALAGLAAPRLASSMGEIRSAMFTMGLATLMILVMPSVYSLPLLSALFVARQFLMNMSSPVMTSFYMGAVHPDERASASAVSGTSWNLPNAITPGIGGGLMQNVNVDLPLYMCGASYSAGVLLVYLFFGDYDKKRRG